MRRTYKYRLYPTRRQEALLLEQLRATRELYNAALEQRVTAYRQAGKSVSYLEQSKELTEIRQEVDWFPPMSRSTHQYALRRLDHSFKGFFRRVKAQQTPGFPRFKGAARWNTLECQYDKGARLLEDVARVYWQGVGEIKVKLHRRVPPAAQRKNVRLTRDADKWYACVELALPKPKPLAPVGAGLADAGLAEAELVVAGVDVGISAFAAVTDGAKDELVAGPRAQRRQARRVATLQRKVARKKRGSTRRRRAVKRLKAARAKEVRVRRDHHFKTAVDLVRRFDVIVFEDLNLAGLGRGVLALDCRDAAWGQFMGITADKAEEAGRQVLFVDPRGTSQECSGCGHVQRKTLSERVHSCAHCGLTLDRDVNAARVIRARGAPLANGQTVHLLPPASS